MWMNSFISLERYGPKSQSTEGQNTPDLSLIHHSAWSEYFQFRSMWRSAPDQIYKTTIFAGCWSNDASAYTKQIEQHGKSGTETTLEH